MRIEKSLLIMMVLVMTVIVSLVSCDKQDELTIERQHRHTKANEKQEEEEGKSGLSFTMEREEMEDDIEELYFNTDN